MAKKTHSSATRITVILLPMLAGAAALAWWRIASTRYDAHVVARGVVSRSFTGTGYVRAKNRCVVSSVVAARVTRILVDEGAHVKAGDVLAELDSEAERLQLKQSVARAEALEAEVEALRKGPRPGEVAVMQKRVAEAISARDEAERNLARQLKLKEQDAIAEAEFDAAETRFLIAKAREEQAKAELKLLEEGTQAEVLKKAVKLAAAARVDAEVISSNLQHYSLRTPFDGVVVRKNLEVGEILSPQKAAFIVESPQREVRVRIDEAFLALVEKAEKVTITCEAYPDKLFDARIVREALAVDEMEGTAEIVLLIDQQPGMPELLSGLAVEATFVVEPQETLVIPLKAIRERGGKQFVMLISDGRLREVRVRTGASDGRMIQLIDGLREGQGIAVFPEKKTWHEGI